MTERSWVRDPVGEISSPGPNFCADSFRYLFHPHVTAVARKRSQSFCQKSSWQVTLTVKHTCILHVALNSSTVKWCIVIWCTQNLH